MDPIVKKLLKSKSFLKNMETLCPDDDDEMRITITFGNEAPVELTSETKKKVKAMRKKLKKEG